MKGFLGILGGAGAFAGLELAKHALDLAVKMGACRDEEFPKLLYYNLPITGLDCSGVVDPKGVFRQTRIAVSQLEGFGCDRIVIACNSAHAFYSKIQGFSAAKIVSLIEVGCRRCADLNVQAVGVLCSSSSRKEELFSFGLGRHGVDALYIDQDQQIELNNIIGRIIGFRHTAADTNSLQTFAMNLRAKGAQVILLGCTELTLAFDPSRIASPTVDCGLAAIEEALTLG